MRWTTFEYLDTSTGAAADCDDGVEASSEEVGALRGERSFSLLPPRPCPLPSPV